MDHKTYELMDLVGPMLNALVTWALVVLGWVVVSDQQQSQTLRDHAIKRIDGLKAKVDSLEDKGINLHSNAFNRSEAIEITKELRNTALELRYLKFAGVVDEKWISLMVALRQALTRKNFDEKSFKVQPIDGDIVQGISAAHAAMAAFLLAAQIGHLEAQVSFG